MLFKSTRALTSVFGQGTIFKQATEIMSFMTDSNKTKIHLVSTPEELPLTETKDLMNALKKLQVRVDRIWLNRYPEHLNRIGKDRPIQLAEAWQKEWDLEQERWNQTQALTQDFKSFIGSFPCSLIPEFHETDDAQFCQEMIHSIEAPHEL
jgi:anion-transporting  ArsA/GET3 family ATPase